MGVANGNEPTFVNYFLTHHPVLGLFWFDDHDPIKGYRRRAVLLGVFLLTFAFTVFKEAAINHVFRIDYHDSDDDALESTRKDMVQLSSGSITSHLIVTVVVAFLAFMIEHFVVWLFGLPSRQGCQTCWCCLCRTAIRLAAAVVLLFCIAVGIFLAVGNKSEVFVGWLYSYGIYACILAPVKLIIFWKCCVHDWQRERAADEKLQQNMRFQHEQQRWAATRAVAATHIHGTSNGSTSTGGGGIHASMPHAPLCVPSSHITHASPTGTPNSSTAAYIPFHPSNGVTPHHHHHVVSSSPNGHTHQISGGHVVVHVGAHS